MGNGSRSSMIGYVCKGVWSVNSSIKPVAKSFSPSMVELVWQGDP